MSGTAWKYLISVSFVLLSSPYILLANGPPINGETAFTTGLNGAAIRSFVKVTRKSGSGGQVTAVAFPIIIPYELLPNKLVLGVGVPLVNKTLKTSSGTKRTPGFGVGDIFIFGKYNLYQLDAHQETFRIAGKLGLTFPTGVDDASDSLGKLPPSLQRGSGSFNPSALLVATKLWRRFGINTDIGYTLFTKTSGLDQGDILRYDVATSYRLIPSVFGTYPDHQINLMLEFNGTLTGKTNTNGIENVNSGGHVLFVSPGIQYIYSTIIVEASFLIPLATSLNGTQLTPDWIALLGFRWLIY